MPCYISAGLAAEEKLGGSRVSEAKQAGQLNKLGAEDRSGSRGHYASIAARQSYRHAASPSLNTPSGQRSKREVILTARIRRHDGMEGREEGRRGNGAKRKQADQNQQPPSPRVNQPEDSLFSSPPESPSQTQANS